jgi:hypothetical protein
MGWNSWDAYGITIDEAQFKANAAVLASLRQYGWQYAVIDAAWYMQDPFASGPKDPKPVWNANGMLMPAVNRYPSAADGAGFKALADWAHAQGLKFGFHIMHGMLRQVAKDNLLIAGSGFHTSDAADPSDSCSWASDYIGVRDNAAGQAYYDSMFKLYASWGIDFVKVDCIAARPSYRPTEIRQIASAIKKSGRAILLSLSPGETALEDAAVLGKYGQMWRVTADHWDYASPQTTGTIGGTRSILENTLRVSWMPLTGWPNGHGTPNPATGLIPIFCRGVRSRRSRARENRGSPGRRGMSSSQNSRFCQFRDHL